MKALLIGNGINMIDESNKFSCKDISERFKENINLNGVLLTKMFLEEDKKIDYYNLSNCNENDNVEQLSGKVYSYIKQKKENFSDNDRYRLIEILACVSIQSIFFQKGILKLPVVPKIFEKIKKEYDKIFTLNYYEELDNKYEFQYLHGKINCNSSKMIFSDFLYKNNKEYRKIVGAEYLENEKQFINGRDLIIMPQICDYTKQIFFGNGLMPSNNLYPADDLFPDGGLGELYNLLDDVKEIDIFGMSPYEDEDLINKINRIPNVNIYVYNLESNIEAKIWQEKIKDTKLVLIDSEEFIT